MPQRARIALRKPSFEKSSKTPSPTTSSTPEKKHWSATSPKDDDSPKEELLSSTTTAFELEWSGLDRVPDVLEAPPRGRALQQRLHR